MKVTLKHNSIQTIDIEKCWPKSKDPKFPYILYTKLCNITNILLKVDQNINLKSKLKIDIDKLSTCRKELSSLIYDYDNRFNFTPPTDIEISTYKRIDDDNLVVDNYKILHRHAT